MQPFQGCDASSNLAGSTRLVRPITRVYLVWALYVTMSSQQRSGVTLRKRAYDSYYENPNFCKYCEAVIPIPEGKAPREARKKKYCNLSCSAKANGNVVGGKNAIEQPFGECFTCGSSFPYQRQSNGGYAYTRMNCDDCIDSKKVENRTVLFLKERYRVKSGRWKSNIRTHARKVARILPDFCSICGYDLHVEVCHIKPIELFDDDSTVGEINKLENLVKLCRNHHWEFDNGHIELDSLING